MNSTYQPKTMIKLCGECGHKLIYQCSSHIDTSIIKEWYCLKCMKYPLSITYVYK